jgi:uridine kinase
LAEAAQQLTMGCRAIEIPYLEPLKVVTPLGMAYHGLRLLTRVSAVVIARGGSCFEIGLRRVIPDCRVGHLLIQTNYRTGEPELHFQKLPHGIESDDVVLLLDPQIRSGDAALMAVRVLLDHGVKEERIVFVTYIAGKKGCNRLLRVYPEMKVVACRVVEELEDRWVATRYFGC